MAEIREGHIPIPGWIFIIVGAVVSGYSKAMEANGTGSLVFFFYCGLALILYGVSKLAIATTKKKFKKDVSEEGKIAQSELDKKRAEWQARNRRLHQQQVHQQSQRQAIINCPFCTARNWASSHFCHQCGKPLN